MRSVLSDCWFAYRSLRKTPGFTAIAVLALALGIGANTAIFSTVDAVLLRALPYRDADRLAMVWQDATFVGYPRATPSPGDYSEWKRQNRVFSGMAAMRVVAGDLGTDGPPEQVMGQAVTPDFFPVLGVQPLIGRVFTDAEDRQAARVAIISYSLWQRRYAGDPNIVGREIPLGGANFSVIGVLPRNFVFQSRTSDYWVPANLTPAMLSNHEVHFLNVVARLKPGVTMTQARENLHAVAHRLQEQGLFDKRSDVLVTPLREDLLGNTRPALLVLLAAAGCVLLIACANLANLLMARSLGRRRREIAVRAALGASRVRLVQQMLIETVVLSCAGGACGLGFAFAGMRLLASLVPSSMPETAVPMIDARLLAFTLALSFVTGLAFGIVPALQTTNASLNETLKQGARGISGAGRKLRDTLVVVEVAAALVLLVGAGLLLRTMANLRGTDVGFRPDHLLTMRTSPAKAMTDVQRVDYYERVVAGVLALPGVESAAFVNDLPFQQSGNSQAFEIEGRDPREGGPARLALYRVGTNSYLKTLGVRVLEGRLFERTDGPSSLAVVVITETLAKRFFIRSPLGSRIRIGGPDAPWSTIIGVVGDVHERGYEAAAMPGVYLPIVQTPNAPSIPRELIVRTLDDSVSRTEAIRQIIHRVNPLQPVSRVRTMEQLIDLDVADRRQQTLLLGVFAGLALMLASIGIYGVLAYGVTQRQTEIGIRIALGATATRVIQEIIWHGLQLTSAGLISGAILSWMTTRVMAKLLYGVRPTDPSTFAGMAVVLLAVAFAACWIPARRASRLDPILVLRDE
ncbi:MAG TPA: ABC transporter permease [Bryobacteraceae bacterium]|nr:ABC transporter permease [Bryobacteraceae bacterium]